MSPEKIAIAVAVTMAAIAGIGAMKKVTGTSSAVAIVAVNPGTAPTKSPNSEAASITTMLYGSSTSEKACAQGPLIASCPLYASSPQDGLQQSPRQRNPEQLVERGMDDQRQDQCKWHDPAHAHAEHGEERCEIDGARR